MSDFLSFYEELVSMSTRLSTEKQVWSSINKLPSEHCEYLYFLILHDYLSHGGEEKSLPFGCKLQMGGKGVLYTVDKLPERTQKLIVAYLVKVSN
ncbi:Hypothetical protein BRZCDTV_162 [Brazilian cedratvirus IHUMI]|uniref:Uncharacterized protein n=1 Tax=Brazilian cedratvirus IHUMI TaxID=2126980 RepID=A0A2R8FDQ7_9VIRU|nr:Hypothetical protein BRZCDTV_162 [Brazilian cedratvirus IHUMI]